MLASGSYCQYLFCCRCSCLLFHPGNCRWDVLPEASSRNHEKEGCDITNDTNCSVLHDTMLLELTTGMEHQQQQEELDMQQTWLAYRRQTSGAAASTGKGWSASIHRQHALDPHHQLIRSYRMRGTVLTMQPPHGTQAPSCTSSCLLLPLI